MTTKAMSLLAGAGIAAILPLPAIAQVDSNCFMIAPSGQYVDLSYLCNAPTPQPQTEDTSNTVPILTPSAVAPNGYPTSATSRVVYGRITDIATPAEVSPSGIVRSSPLRLRNLPDDGFNPNSLQTIIIDSPTRINTVRQYPVRLRTLNDRLSEGFEGNTIYQPLPDGVNYFISPIYY